MINNTQQNQSDHSDNVQSNIHSLGHDANIMTVFEHQRLTMHDFLRVSDFHWLMAQEFSVFSIKRQQGRWQLKVGHYIGVILLPSGIILEILPKLNQSVQNSNLVQTRRWVQNMLSDLTNDSSPNSSSNKLPNTKNFGQFSTQLTSLPIEALPLSDWLTVQFLQRLARYQPTKHYQSKIHNQAALQGRLLIKEQLRQNSMHPHKFVCESSVLSQDMLGNRLIKSALMLLLPLLSKSMAAHSLQAWHSISALSQHEMQRLDSIYHQAKQQLASQPFQIQTLQAAQQLIDLAYWLLRQSATATGNGIDPSTQNLSRPRLCLLIDMNQAFEQWASQRIASMFNRVSSNYRPFYQAQRVWLTDANGQAHLSIRPDLLIYKTALDDNDIYANPYQEQNDIGEAGNVRAAGHYSHVIDMKWKHLSHASNISASDAYQLTSYGQAYQSEQVWLVYPVQDDERQPVALSQQSLNDDSVFNNGVFNNEVFNNGAANNSAANNRLVDKKSADKNTQHTQLWLVPFNVLTGTVNNDLLLDLNGV